jgi:hypothetical protein
MNKLFSAVMMSVLVVGAGVAQADKVAAPVKNVSAKKHPNLAAAQKLIKQAFDKIEAAQKANEYDMEGHAAKAKELLDQAAAELKQAAETANENAPKK